MSYWYNHNRYRELGGIQLRGQSHWYNQNDFWNERSVFSWRRYRDAWNMEQLEKDLHYDGKEKKNISLVSQRYENVSHPTTHYHADLLPRWEAFAEAQTSNDQSDNDHSHDDSSDDESINESSNNVRGLEKFSIVRVQLPPAPFFAQQLMPVINNNRDTLTTLQLRGCDLQSKDIVPITRFIKNNSTLNILDIEVQLDSMRDTKSLSNAIKGHPELTFVNLSKCGLGADVKILKVVLDGVCNVKSLLLEGNDIGTEDNCLDLVANFLSSNKDVTVFSIADNGIVGKKKTGVLSKAMKKNTTIQELCVGEQKIDVRPFLGSKRITDTLNYLDLGGCKMNTAGAKQMAAFVKSNPPLAQLNLAKNGIPSSTDTLWGEALKANTNLEHLNLQGNYFNDKSISTWKDVLKTNRTLRSLDLSKNKISTDNRRWVRTENGTWERDPLTKKNSRRDLILDTMCDATSFQSILESNHVCQLFLANGNNGVLETHERDMRKINALENEGAKIRYKVVLAMFKLNTDLYNPRGFDDVPLELMPRLLELVQQELGYNGFGTNITTRRRYDKDPTLRRLYEVFTSWNIPLLVARGAGKLPPPPKPKRKRKIKTEEEEDEDWKPTASTKYAAKSLARKVNPKRKKA